jgi:hypothetical protein
MSDIKHPAIEEIKADLAEIELDVLCNFTLADAMREGAQHTDQITGDFLPANGNACALGAAFLSIKARGYDG